MIFLPIVLMINVYRICRIAEIEIKTVNGLTGIIFVVDIVLGTLLFFFPIKEMVWAKENRH